MQTLRAIRNSAAETIEGCRWIYRELISQDSKKYASIAVLLQLAAVCALTAIPFTTKEAIDALGVKNDSLGIAWVVGGGLAGILACTFGTLQDHFRERAWNMNYYTVHIRLMEKLYARTLDEIIGAHSEIGAEQIESLKDRVQNILYLFLFEGSLVVSTVVNALVFMLLLDPTAAAIMVGLTVFNLCWFLYFNVHLDSKMEPIDTALRRANRRLVEKLNLASMVKTAGVERKIITQVGEELTPPLQEDFLVWGLWFPKLEYVRRCINALAPTLVLCYGVVIAHWSIGTLAAMATWTYAISREYGFIGHLMRHLTSQVARIKAAREALSVPPAFSYDNGIMYRRRKQ